MFLVLSSAFSKDIDLLLVKMLIYSFSFSKGIDLLLVLVLVLVKMSIYF